MRYFLQFAYQGTHYHGYQVQPNALTVQEVLEEKLAILLGQKMGVVASGRTDTGVHAADQWLHFDYEAALPPNFVYRLNSLLPEDIGIYGLYTPTDPELHARFSAVRRQYRYVIARKKDPLLHRHSLLRTKPLDAAAMQQAARLLFDFEDFASFCKAGGDQHTTLCTIYRSDWEFQQDIWVYRVAANRFLRGMVRAIVGTLLMVGEGKIPPQAVADIIAAKDRSQAGMAAPAEGLFLEKVDYPEGSLLQQPL